MSAPGGAPETQYDQNIQAGLLSPFPGLSAGGFLPPRVPRVTAVTRFTLGYGCVALPGLKAPLCRASRVSRQSFMRGGAPKRMKMVYRFLGTCNGRRSHFSDALSSCDSLTWLPRRTHGCCRFHGIEHAEQIVSSSGDLHRKPRRRRSL